MIWVGIALLGVAGLWLAVRPGTAPTNVASTPAPLLSAPPAAPSTNRLAKADGSYLTPADRAADFERCRVSNTTEALSTFLRRDSALLLENATLDTASALPASIPAHLRSVGDPGAYIVQARGVVTEAFRARLREAGATLVSYIPNNAWLVRASAARVAWLQAQPEVLAAIPFEPFYKIKSTLLPLAVDQQPLPAGTFLNVLIFSDNPNATRAALLQTGANILAEARSPFGPVLQLAPAPASLPALAALPGVQLIERAGARITANDLSRVKMGVSTDTTNALTYLGLTGSNIVVNVTDSGVDATHPDLLGRVFGDTNTALVDLEGHGTHVAGIIAASGVSSSTVPTNPPGSVLGASYRGKAPAASIFSLSLGVSRLAELGEDSYAQERIASTNILISNNSWVIGGVSDYDIFSASYDAAVRDALPGVTGSQPVLFVFAAGNDGSGNSLGLGGFAGTVLSPGTGKNVITVGGLEQLRGITNEVVLEGVTNAIWAGGTDSDSQVAGYSGRGNVGIGIEGEFGRFKPDVVAPGTFVISTRSAQWDTNAYYSITNTVRQSFPGLGLTPGELAQFSVFVPEEVLLLRITALARPIGTNTPVALPIYVREGGTPTVADFVGFNSVALPPDAPLVVPGNYGYAIGNPTNFALTYDLQVELTYTNGLEDYFRVLRGLNEDLGGQYRYESGTSMAAPGVSGVLALMQEYYEQRLGRTNSPALMKALLINGARTVDPLYDLQVRSTVNHQGWGLADIRTSVPATNTVGATALAWFDQSPTNTLTTGQSQTRNLTLANGADTRPLRVTLVWTDPPGNPVAGLKLVNDLDLVVTNLDSGEVYFGNDITGGSFNSVWATNGSPVVDSVNNVENVFIAPPVGTNFSVTVRARSVNVNAITAHPDGIAQDYALVISSGDQQVASAFTVTPPAVSSPDTRNVTIITNTTTTPLPLFNQTVGANSQFIVTTNGATNQWHFYVITNNTGFTNAAFLTFLPPTLATPRMGVRSEIPEEISRNEADIDLYVSRNSGLTNLDPVVIAGALKSVGRGGTEVVAISDPSVGEPDAVYYIGVKSEDQMAAEYAFFAGFSELPFSELDADGNLIVRGFPAPVVVPDGSPANPGAGFVFGIATLPMKVRKVVVTNTITHENIGDLLGNLSHNNAFVVLNNKSFGNGAFTQQRTYDDSEEDPLSALGRSDGPGSLRDFVDEEAAGLWLLTMIDDAAGQTGRVDNLTIKIEPNTLDEGFQDLLIPANGWGYATIEVPVEATNLVLGLTWRSDPALPVDMYARRGDFPTFTDYDKKATVIPPGSTNVFSIGKGDLPPLQAGTYYVGVFNPNNVPQAVRLYARLELDLNGVVPDVFASLNTPFPLLDDAVTHSTITVSNDQKVITVEAGLRINHPRVADLAIQLVGPEGNRVLLIENRGALEQQGLGADIFSTNTFAPVNSSGGPEPFTNTITIPATATQRTLRITYDFFFAPDTLSVFYGPTLIYGPPPISGAGFVDVTYGPGTETNLFIVINAQTNAAPETRWQFIAAETSADVLYTTFTEATNKANTLIKFALPPFAGSSLTVTGATFLNDGFELSPPGIYPFGTAVSGWTVAAGDVEVVASAAAQSPPNYLELNGTTNTGTVVTNIATVTGRQYILDFASSRNPGLTNGPALGQLDITGNPTVFLTYTNANDPANLNWTLNTVNFTAVAAQTALSFAGLNNGMLIDSVLVREITVAATNAYFPEEPLTAFKGTEAQGDWTLEVWDRRTGATNIGPALVSWNLSFIFETVPISAISLEHATPVTVNIPPGSIQYFIVDVPPWALFATNTLVSSEIVDVWFNQNGAPLAVNLPDFLLMGPNVTVDTKTLDTLGSGGLPTLLPGQRYYLGITNKSATASIVTYRVDYDVTALTNAIPYTAVTASNGIPRYFSYNVSTNALGVIFDLSGLDGDLDLIARRGALPTLQNYNYGSFRPGTNDEDIIVFPNSTPVPLTPGVWFLGVFNRTTNAVNYNVRATEITNALPTIITLFNQIPYAATNLGVPGSAQYFRYPVTTAAARVQFETFGADGDVTLVASRGLPLPDLFAYDYRSANGGTNDELIVILTNSTPVNLTSGDWFITAVKISSGPMSYNIKATEWPSTGRPIQVISAGPDGFGSYCITWNSLVGVHYYVQGRTNFASPVWVTASDTITAFATTTTWCTPWPTPFGFFRVVEGIVPGPVVASPTTITSIVRTPTDVTLTWFGPDAGNFLVEWSDSLNPATWLPFTTLFPVEAPAGIFTFIDDGSEGAFTGTRFYRVIQLP